MIVRIYVNSNNEIKYILSYNNTIDGLKTISLLSFKQIDISNIFLYINFSIYIYNDKIFFKK